MGEDDTRTANLLKCEDCGTELWDNFSETTAVRIMACVQGNSRRWRTVLCLVCTEERRKKKEAMESRSNCCICNELKPNEMFSSTQRAKNALRRMCKDCDARGGKDALPILVPETLPLRLLAFVSKPPRWQMSLLLHIFETVPLKGALRFGPACHIFWDLTSRDNPDLDSAVLAPYIVQHTTNRDATWQNLRLVAWGGGDKSSSRCTFCRPAGVTALGPLCSV